MIKFGELSEEERKSFSDEVEKSLNKPKRFKPEEQQVFIEDETTESKEEI